MSDYKVNLVNDEQPSIQEREEKVLKDAGADVGQDNTYKLDLTKTQENAVQEQSTDEVPVQDEPEASQEVVEEVRSSEEPTEQKEEVEQVLELIKEDSDAEKLQVEEQETNGQEANEEKLLQKEEVKEGFSKEDRVIDSHIKRIRQKFILVDPNFNLIKTIYGIGYKIQ